MSIEFRERPTMEHAFHWKCGSPMFSWATSGAMRKASISITEGH